ncbi:MAG: stage V sporulation protein AA [Defluviitaleaceae bacterium]|nr:stage V sporulation protein AA [Defluviitaleaceae bacterium]
MDIYIKPKKKAALVGKADVTVKDIADVYAPADMQKRVEGVKLLTTDGADGVYLVSVIDVVKAVTATLPGHTITNLGEMDTMVSIKAKPPKKRPFVKWLKVAMVSLVLFVGASSAIMAFHTDSQLTAVFKQYHKMFFGQEVEKPLIINIPYSIGLALGIVVFFNHFGGKRLTKEPTPIEVEMATYEKDVEDAVIQTIELKNEKQEKRENK